MPTDPVCRMSVAENSPLRAEHSTVVRPTTFAPSIACTSSRRTPPNMSLGRPRPPTVTENTPPTVTPDP
jgi:hypothetical protein